MIATLSALIGLLGASLYHIGKGTPVKGLKVSAYFSALMILRILWVLA